MENSRDVKSIVEQLRETDRPEHHIHKIIHQPWGTVTLLEEDENHQVSTWHIYPDGIVHLDTIPAVIRHIYVIDGTGVLESASHSEKLKSGDTTVISTNQESTIQNTDREPLVFVQVQIHSDH